MGNLSVVALRGVEDGVDDATGVADGDALAGSVPTSVHEVSLGTVSLHFLHEFSSILGGMEFQESLSEASGEGGSGFGDAALCSCEFCGEAGEEIVLSLVAVEDGDGRQYAESVSGEEDDLLGSGTLADGLYDVLDVVDGVADAGVFGHALVCEVNLSVSSHGDVLEECVALDGTVDVGFAFFVEVDDLGIASTFIVEDAVVVPSVFVVADEFALQVLLRRLLLPMLL